MSIALSAPVAAPALSAIWLEFEFQALSDIHLGVPGSAWRAALFASLRDNLQLCVRKELPA